MNYRFLITLTLFFFNSLLVKADISFEAEKSITLSGDSCAEVEDYAGKILNWTQSVIKNFDKELPSCYCSSGSCKIDVYSVSPAIVRDRTTFLPGQAVTRVDGPNCFNSAFLNSGTLSNLRAVHSDETTALYKSSLCRERPLNEAMEAGDIVAIRDQSNKFFEVHAATFISEGLYFSKKGFSAFIPYQYSQSDLKVYKVDDDACKRIYGVPKKGEKCFNKPFVNVFTCTSFSKYISDMNGFSDVMSEPTVKLYQKISRLESKISSMLEINKSRARTGDKEKALAALIELNQMVKDIGDLSSYSAQEAEFLKLMIARFTSLDFQMEYFLR